MHLRLRSWRCLLLVESHERDAERAEAERLLYEGKPVISIGWGDGGKIIEQDAGPEPSNKN
jgi:hypothetical protein